MAGSETPTEHRFCQRPYYKPSQTSTGPKRVACGRAKCSRECQAKWASRIGACFRISFGELPPTHHFRLTIRDNGITNKLLTEIVGSVLKKMKYKLKPDTFDYLVVNEWSKGKRHHHIVLRTSERLTARFVRPLVEKTLVAFAKRHPNVHLRSLGKDDLSVMIVRNPVGLAKYVVKDLKDRSKAELPPAEFKGRIFTMSQTFLVRPRDILLNEVKAKWNAKRVELDLRRAAAGPNENDVACPKSQGTHTA